MQRVPETKPKARGPDRKEIMKVAKREVVVPLRIVLRDPIPGVALRLQSGRDELVAPTSATSSSVVFDFTVRVVLLDGDGPVNFLGPFTQGPPRERFVYVNAGRRAGQPGTAWDRRAKIPLKGIDAKMIAQARAAPGSIIAVHIDARGKDGGPVCATVKLPADAWRVHR
jgi:hypothetical protein